MTTEIEHPDDEPTAAEQIADADSLLAPGDPAADDSAISAGEALSRGLD